MWISVIGHVFFFCAQKKETRKQREKTREKTTMVEEAKDKDT